MSTSDVGSVERESSDGSGSDQRESEGARTEITSLMETDAGDDVGGDDDVDMESDDEVDMEDVEGEAAASEVASLYAVSHYPTVHASHRVEMPYGSHGSFRWGQDHDGATV